MVFVNLDPADPNRVFFVILDVIDDKVWNSKYMSIVQCSSLLHHTKLMNSLVWPGHFCLKS